MIHDRKAQDICELDVNGVSMKFSKLPKGIKVSTHFSCSARVLREQLGDYGRFMDCEDFCCEGNIFADLKSALPLKERITPRQHEVSEKGGYQREGSYVLARLNEDAFIELYKPLCLSLPINDDVKILLASLFTQSTNEYLVTRVIQCPPDPRWPDSSRSTSSFCAFVKPLIWNQNAGTDSVSEERSGDETMSDQARVNDADGMELLSATLSRRLFSD